MSGRNGRSNGARRLPAAALLIAACLLAALSSCSAAAPASNTPSKKPKTSVSPPSARPIDPRSLSSVVLPIQGNVYPKGTYYATLNIGEPPKPYFLDVDSGSDITWLHCDAPCVHCPKCPHPLYKPVKNKLALCKDPLCNPLPGHRDCNKSPLQCDYEIYYGDHSSSLGVLIRDTFAIPLTNQSVARPQLAFGCGYDQEGPGMNGRSPVDGVLSLGSGPTSFVSQLQAQGLTRSVVGHCLGRSGTGYLFFGDALIPPHGITWAPMSHSATEEHKYYSPGPANLFLGKQPLGVLQLVFDSGSSYTYFANQPYQAFLSAVKNDLSKTPLREATEDRELAVCWKGPKPFKSVLDVKNYFRPLVLSFANAKGAQLVIPPESYLIITSLHNACLGILNGTEMGLEDLTVIGDISMQDLMVIYDNEKQQIGWVRASCDRLPKSANSPL